MQGGVTSHPFPVAGTGEKAHFDDCCNGALESAGTIFGRTPMMRSVASLVVACLALVGGLTPNPAAAYPTRPVTLVLGFAPGGPSDVMARIFGKRLEQALGQPVVIENRSG